MLHPINAITHRVARWICFLGNRGRLKRRRAAAAGLLLAACAAAAAEPVAVPERCSYETYTWNVARMRAEERRRVEKPYGELTPGERDAATGCTVCSEDQVEITLPGVAPFRVCRHLAPRVDTTLRQLQQQGVPIRSVVGYRVGLTRGAADSAGNRTGFSNHSYGVALDINEEANGLYESCLRIGAECRLRKGGRWEPERNPLSMTADHPVVVAMKGAGFRWGGELAGRQKDFMHFSPSGD